MSTPNNKCAFPSVYDDRTITGRTTTVVNEGMNLRTYLAGQAMVGILSGADFNAPFENVAHQSVAIADALIAELAKTK